MEFFDYLRQEIEKVNEIIESIDNKKREIGTKEDYQILLSYYKNYKAYINSIEEGE